MSEYINSVQRDHEVRELDPCGLDDFLIDKLPKLNTDVDTTQLVEQAKRGIPNIDWLNGLTLLEAQAATRDIGFIAASLVRHGISLNFIPGLERGLLALSSITKEVPRDTVYSYGLRNPQGDRMRTFIGTEEERIFIRSVSDAMETLPICLKGLLEAQMVSIHHPSYGGCLMQAVEAFQDMVDAMVTVRRAISPQFFSDHLRPYFPPFKIGGELLFAPGGAQMPLLLIDRIIWGSSYSGVVNKVYEEYYQDNKKYLPPEFRSLASEMDSQRSLISEVQESNRDFDSLSVANKASVGVNLELLESLVTQILKFRLPHLVVAKSNMQIRTPGSLGSGGYNTDILDLLIQLTLQAKTIVYSLRI